MRPQGGAGFAAEPLRWFLPRGPAGGGFAVPYGEAWSMVDLDGDRRPELVWLGLRRTGADGSARIEPFVSGDAAHWRVYRNTGTGFELDATSWTLPGELGRELGWSLVGLAPSELLDVDGDERPELVVTARPGGQPGALEPLLDDAGQPVWWVFHNTGRGFADAPEHHRLPQDAPVLQAHGASWMTTDLHADGRLDLVLTGTPGPDGRFGPFEVAGGGDPHWRVHRGLGDGFADDAHHWSLPLGFAMASTPPLSDASWALLDLDGDRRPELVHTGQAQPGTMDYDLWGQPTGPSFEVLRDGPSVFWEVFPNNGASYSPAHRHRVPESDDPRGFALPDNSYQTWLPGATSAAGWTVVDLDGDRVPEFVDHGFWAYGATLAPWGRPGEPYWKVHRVDGRGGGFTRHAERWRLPPDVVLDAVHGFGTQTSWTVLDLDGDGVHDLVRSAQWVATAEGARLEVRQDDEGRTYWLVHPGQVSGSGP